MASAALEEEPDAGLPEGDGEEFAPSEEAVTTVMAAAVLESEVDVELPEAVRPEEEADPLGGREVAAGLGAELQELEVSVLAADLDLGVKGFSELLY